ncbi:Hypothetical predicted protein, partial [Paramuricea clavata]
MAQFNFVAVCLIIIVLLKISTSFTEGLVLKSEADNARYTSPRQDVASESTLPTNAQTRAVTGKVGAFVGGKMFDYFLT